MSNVEAKVVEELIEGSTPEERRAIAAWAQKLLDIRNSSDDPFSKSREAFMATIDGKAGWPIIRRLGDAIKRNAWDERSPAERAGVAGATAMVALFGGMFAVLTALGTAVGAPMWIVFGTGDDVARKLIAASDEPTIV